jgi:MoaA/NifB/PqqE/SkfB family radical SAM enzyme
VHPEHLRLFKYALDAGIKCALVTNGNVLRDGWVDILPRFEWLRVSLDAGTPETYAAIRGIGAHRFERTLENIRRLRAAITEAGSRCALGVGYVVTRENMLELVAATSQARDAGADNIRIGAMYSSEGVEYYAAKHPVTGVPFYQTVKLQLALARELATRTFRVHDVFGERMDDLEHANPEYSRCWYQEFVTYVAGDLNVYRCCNTAYTKHGALGSLSTQRLRDLWQRPGAKADFETFDARSCPRCIFNAKNRVVGEMVMLPTHPDFV